MTTLNYKWTACLSITSESFNASTRWRIIFNTNSVLSTLDITATGRRSATPSITIITKITLTRICSNFIYTFCINVTDMKTCLTLIDVNTLRPIFCINLLVTGITNAFKRIIFNNACTVRSTSFSTFLTRINI